MRQRDASLPGRQCVIEGLGMLKCVTTYIVTTDGKWVAVINTPEVDRRTRSSLPEYAVCELP